MLVQLLDGHGLEQSSSKITQVIQKDARMDGHVTWQFTTYLAALL
jgi:hypothetical protein